MYMSNPALYLIISHEINSKASALLTCLACGGSLPPLPDRRAPTTLFLKQLTLRDLMNTKELAL
jgi:hypothetical protein